MSKMSKAQTSVGTISFIYGDDSDEAKQKSGSSGLAESAGVADVGGAGAKKMGKKILFAIEYEDICRERLSRGVPGREEETGETTPATTCTCT
mmetsp:Transcript_15134/g.25224  ORF Transcript_15134/g.25224 Transcript_15134/m.25224 type:complete len:93 (-) Transcript_15134:251-529(-)|eukprot:CAMPEP_0197724178 /NCGR_PEP_ID=MMETSP1434-20131217/6194_1 /TAXON_ID=265543 /ORGANISM="Minutocellus polymorphus, Strain CCMP3303" /LENGTH=92 /DNA_ID=CAMNT_0043309499 /DNA_START=263 /DNA_END=541 /DNA_ORIENTATION=+